MTQRPDLKFCLFTAFTPGGPLGTEWNHPGNKGFDYLDLNHQTKLAQALEAAAFDAIFWADFSGVHDTYKSSPDVAVRDAVQFPLGDPLVLTAALASATENLGFAFSANVVQQHPYGFARRVATLDHLTKGRVAWNMLLPTSHRLGETLDSKRWTGTPRGMRARKSTLRWYVSS